MILLMEVWETAVFASTWFLCHEFLSPWLPCHDFCWWNISLLCQMHPLPHLLRICASIFAALCVLGGFHFYLVPGRYRYGFNMIQLQHGRGWCFSIQRVHGWFKRFSRKGRSYFSFTFAETSCLILNERWRAYLNIFDGWIPESSKHDILSWAERLFHPCFTLADSLAVGPLAICPWTQILTNQTTIEFQLNIVRRRQCRRNGELLGRELHKGWLDVRSSNYWYQKDLKSRCNSIPVSWIGITPTSLKPVSVYCEKLGVAQVPAVCR